MSRRVPRGTGAGQPPRAPFDLIDELSCYYDTLSEPNNVHLEVLVPGPVDYPALRQAVAGALAATPRARGRMVAGRAFRFRYTWEFPSVPDVDPVSHAEWSDEAGLAAARGRFLASSPPLRVSPPVRLLLASGPGVSCVILNAHHAAMDGMSGLELLRDIAARYRTLTGDPECPGTPAGMPPGPGQAAEAPVPPVSSGTVPSGTVSSGTVSSGTPRLPSSPTSPPRARAATGSPLSRRAHRARTGTARTPGWLRAATAALGRHPQGAGRDGERHAHRRADRDDQQVERGSPQGTPPDQHHASR